MTELGKFTASYNKNTKSLYINFIGSLQINEKLENCGECTSEQIEEHARKLLAKWFLKINESEEKDIAESPFVFTTTKEKLFADKTLKFKEIIVSQK